MVADGSRSDVRVTCPSLGSRGDGLAAAEGEERDPPSAAADSANVSSATCGGTDELSGTGSAGRAARELAPERAAAIEAHAAQCDACGRRLGWLRREDEVSRVRGRPP